MKASRSLVRAIAIGAVGIVIGALGGIGLWGALQPRTTEAEPLTTQPVLLEPYVAPTSVSLKPVYASTLSPRVYASGTVRQFDCVTGVAWNSGETLLTVDDRALPNLALPRPPWRSLSVGDRGDDVKELQQSLRELGFDITPDGVFGPNSLGAWKTFVADKSVTQAALEDYVWVPPGFVAESCDFSLGDMIAGPISPASGGSRIVSFAVSGLPVNDELERTVVVGTERIPLNKDSIDDPAIVSSLVAQPVVAAALSTEDAAVAATAELSTPIDAARLVASAVIIDGDRACVASGEQTYEVTIIDSALGRTIVTFNDAIPDVVNIDRKITEC